MLWQKNLIITLQTGLLEIQKVHQKEILILNGLIKFLIMKEKKLKLIFLKSMWSQEIRF